MPLPRAAREALDAGLDRAWADPARLHHFGRFSGAVLDQASAGIREILGAPDARIYWGSSAAEVITMVITSLAAERVAAGATPAIVVSAVETFAVLGAAERSGMAVTPVGVDGFGEVDAQAFGQAVQQGAAVACLQAANAEVGTLQPLAAVHAACGHAGTPLVVDATAGMGLAWPDAWDLLVAAGRDWGAPAGAAFVAVRPEVRWSPPLAPDRGWLGGFPNVPAAAAAAHSLAQLAGHAAEEGSRLFALSEALRIFLDDIPSVQVLGAPEKHLPHIVTALIHGASGEEMVHALGARGVAVASGSACTADTSQGSHVLRAMGVTPADQHLINNLRISLPIGCTSETVDMCATELSALLQEFTS
jgi:cysteine desulfurase